MVAVDPVASLRITTVDVHLGGRTFEIGKHSAADWLEVIIDGRLHRVLPGWLDDGEAAIFTEMFLDGYFGEEDISTATLDAITVVGGRKHWWIFNILGQAVGAWSIINGALVRAGVKADEISLSAWTDAAYSYCVEQMQDQKQRIQFDAYLEAPPAGTAIDEEEEGEAFLALMASM